MTGYEYLRLVIEANIDLSKPIVVPDEKSGITGGNQKANGTKFWMINVFELDAGGMPYKSIERVFTTFEDAKWMFDNWKGSDDKDFLGVYLYEAKEDERCHYIRLTGSALYSAKKGR